ncbi:MAG: M14 family metallopeptidase, partial [Bacteroidota bacterium]
MPKLPFIRTLILTIFLITYCRLAYGQVPETRFETSNGEESATYDEVITFYQKLAQNSPAVRMVAVGATDFGKPLHLVLLSRDQVFDPQSIKAQGKAFLLINNGIHPGEPCGIDASLMLARDLVAGKAIPENLVIGIIPLYNIGGAHNRSSFSRANQVGPQAYGFRGNARNYDLNRDFMKMDTRNTQAFAEIFQRYLPDVFVDTHTTNGADYQAVMTLIETQHNKLQPAAEEFMTQRLTPALYRHMEAKGQVMSPYVNIFGRTPDDGFAGFLDLPRYSTGYTALFQSLSYVTEAHMLKPFSARVEATYTFLEGMISYLADHAGEVTTAVQLARRQAAMAEKTVLNWTLDTTQVE